MNRQAIAKELVSVAKELAFVAASRKPKYTSNDVQALVKDLEGFVHRGGRDYGDYQFNIKLRMVSVPDSVSEEYGDSVVSEISMEEAADRVSQLGDEVKRRFAWVGDWSQSGNSGGWFCITDNDGTLEILGSLGAADDLERFDKLKRDERGVWYRSSPWDDEDELWKELSDEVEGAVKEGEQKIRDLGEIEKMVKAGIADFKKDMNSEQWWKSRMG
jgi:uncharacterized protein YheU (UPF0270 family)